MSRSRRIILFGTAGLVGLLVIGAVALLLMAHSSDLRARLETAASSALGLEVSVGGRPGIAFFPGVRVTLEDVRIRNGAVDIASAKEARLGIDLLPLLKREVRVREIALKSPRLSIERDGRGQFNFEKPRTAEETLPALDWPNVSLTDATFVYTDKQSGGAVDAENCRLDLHRLQLAGGKRSNLLKAVSFSAELSCGQVRSDGLTMSDLKSTAEAKDGVLDLKPVTTRVFETQGSGTVRADFSGATPRYQVRFSLSQFPVEAFFKTISAKRIAAGRMDFSANVSMQGTSAKEVRQTMNGQVSLRGKNLMLADVDLDGQLSRFESSQNFNLVDLGAFFFAGPLGVMVTKGYDFASILQQGGGGSTEIRALVSDWKVERGVANAQDVAMSTKDNRVALQGGLDFVNGRFDEVTVAVIDSKGCAKVHQKIRGTFQNPVVDKPNLLTSVTAPALKLLKRGRDIVSGGRCDVFYAGSVAAPA